MCRKLHENQKSRDWYVEDPTFKKIKYLFQLINFGCIRIQKKIVKKSQLLIWLINYES